MEKEYKGVPTFYAQNRQTWRDWLAVHHASEPSVWLVLYKKESGVPSVYYSEAVDEALCFGWIDSKPNKRDKDSYYQFFARRNPKSNWSRVNKDKVARLIEQGLMQPAGHAMIELAKQTGTWDALNGVENLTLPDDLRVLFEQTPVAYKHWELFPRSVKRGILEWILNAKKPETRRKRIEKTVAEAEKNRRANHGKP